MPSDLTVSRIPAASPAGGETRPPPPPPRDPTATPAGTAMPNPSLRLDPALSMVVIEFRDDSGAVRSSIPSQQQLDAYRAWERSNTGPPPRAGTAPEVPPAPSATPADATSTAGESPAIHGMETSAD